MQAQPPPVTLQNPGATPFHPRALDALRRIVWRRAGPRVALIGASKNSGKTTALNALCASAYERLGLCSIGRDGEEHDAWSGAPKPKVRVEKGTLVVTVAACAQASGGLLKRLHDLGIVGPLGPVGVYEARAPGGVELAGVPHRTALRAAVAALQERGAVRVLIDGAYHRQAAAHADVADAVIVAVGAILGASCTEAAQMALPTLRALAVGPPRAPSAVVPGALSDAKLPALLKPGVELAVRNPADVLLHERGWQLLDRAGASVTAHRPLPFLCATTSPFAGAREPEDPAAMQRAVAAAVKGAGLPPLPLVDVVAGLVREEP